MQALFQQLAANMNLTHAKWANTLANNSFFVEQVAPCFLAAPQHLPGCRVCKASSLQEQFCCRYSAGSLQADCWLRAQDFIVEKHAYRLHPDPQEETPGALWNTPEGPPRYWHYQVRYLRSAILSAQSQSLPQSCTASTIREHAASLLHALSRCALRGFTAVRAGHPH